MPRPPLTVELLEAREVPAAAFETLPVVPADDAAVIDSVRAIALRGQLAGRSTTSLLVAGDSNSATIGSYYSGFLAGYGKPFYNPAGLAAVRPDLVATVTEFRAGGSFVRPTTSAVPGFRATDLAATIPGALASSNVGVALVMIGTNDLFWNQAEAYREQLRAIVRTLTAAGVVPLLSTIPPNTYNGGVLAGRVLELNQIVADVADEFRVPVWNLWRGVASLPGGGLAPDGVHLVYEGDGASVNGASQNVRNLEALDVLAWFRRVVTAPADVPAARAWSPLAKHEAVFATGRDIGQAAVVNVFDAAGHVRNEYLAFGPDFTGGVRVATADVTGDGVPDIVVGAGLGGAPAVKVFSGADGSEAASFFAFESSFRGGVNVAASDLDGDGVAEVVAGAGEGGGPAVAVYRGGDFAEVARFFAYESSFRGGVNVAAGEVDGVGPAIVTGAGNGGGPVVKVYRLGESRPVFSYAAYDAGVRTGVWVAVVNSDVATAPVSGAPHVKLTDAATGAERASFFAPVAGAVRLGVLREAADVLLTAGAARTYRGEQGDVFGLNDAGRSYGVYVG
ncbi:SGNH/GDSL hydrolase family protein [Urbifossiella limnaea]|uniref:FG-GAP repeat protein n=1 Tax=Urbifossiella limnaea TaxID=2528023 RepID=A0A517XT10_9BACT|nr:SGNH/GDSL hydrolase family protein [Urbifossiella limnaea]QDU20631.1 FG-GAP repeat protein [Urbifossiella limnaea]